MSATSETRLPLATENELRDAFVAMVPFQLPDVRVFVRTILNVEAKGGWRARAGIPGQCDLYAVRKGGLHIEIECKAAKHKWYRAQIAWREFCQEWSIPYLVLRALPGEHPHTTVGRWIGLLREEVAREA